LLPQSKPPPFAAAAAAAADKLAVLAVSEKIKQCVVFTLLQAIDVKNAFLRFFNFCHVFYVLNVFFKFSQRFFI